MFRVNALVEWGQGTDMFPQSDLYHDTLDVMARDPRIVNAIDDNAAAKVRL